jgi:hypothetical protein
LPPLRSPGSPADCKGGGGWASLLSRSSIFSLLISFLSFLVLATTKCHGIKPNPHGRLIYYGGIHLDLVVNGTILDHWLGGSASLPPWCALVTAMQLASPCMGGHPHLSCVLVPGRLCPRLSLSWVYEFWLSDVTTCSKLFEIFTMASACDGETTRQVSSISEFVWILYNLKTLSTHVTPHVTTPTWS